MKKLIAIVALLTACTKTVQKTPTPVQNNPPSVQKIKITYKIQAGFYPCSRTFFFPDSIGGQTQNITASAAITFYLPQSVTKRTFSVAGSIATHDSVYTEIWINDTLRAKNKGGNASNSTILF